MHRSSRIVGASISRSSSTTTTIVCINPTIIYDVIPFRNSALM